MKTILSTIIAISYSLIGIGQSAQGSSQPVDLGPLLFKKLNEKTNVIAQTPTDEPINTENAPLVPVVELNSDVDKDIPVNAQKNKDAFAVVIGNAQYQFTTNVDYAVHDARAMKEYVINTLGFQEENVSLIENATQSDFQKWFGTDRSPRGRLYNLVYENIEDSTDVFVFYAGHGAPDPNTKSGYFLPVDCDPNLIDVTAYPGELLFQNLDKIGAKSTTIVLDACFSGSGVITGLSAVAIKPKDFGDIRNGVILSSSSGTQPSAWYNEENHGLFTYYFLKALQNRSTDFDSDGLVTIDEVYKYVDNMVPRKARGLRNLDQNPTIRGENRNKVLYSLNTMTE